MRCINLEWAIQRRVYKLEEKLLVYRPNYMKALMRMLLGVAAASLVAAAALGHPGSGILVDRMGQVYFIDTGSGLWKIDTRGGLSHLSPLRNHWLAMDPNNRFTQARLPTDPGRDWVITAAGSNPTILISTDFPLVIGLDGHLYYPSVRERDRRILRQTAAGVITTFATLPSAAKGEQWINGIATGPDGSIYYTDDAAVRRITAQGKVSTVGSVPALANGPKIPGTDLHPYLRGIKVDRNGGVYVADAGDARVLKITPDGKVSTLVQLESPWAPTDVALFGRHCVCAGVFPHGGRRPDGMDAARPQDHARWEIDHHRHSRPHARCPAV